MPTRVLDIGDANDFTDLKLVLTNETCGEYIVLSHCWGGHISPLLKTDTLGSWQENIPFGALAANFQDAIRLTRSIGKRYLWIDALCIIQDSVADWETESKHMGPVYRNSYLSISASSSRASTAGFLKNYGPTHSQQRFCMMPRETDFKTKNQIMLALSLTGDEDESLRDLFIRAPVHQRGWCLQETTLASRVLHVGKKQMYYQCQ